MPVIATNTSANTALIYLNRNSEDQAKSLSKLSSGSRIVSASDDAAGLAVASRLSADITTLEQAGRNVLQGRAVLQTADGALARIGDILQRMKALAAQSRSGSVDDPSRAFLDAEFDELRNEINAIETATTFNGQALIDGTFTGAVATFLVGSDAADTIVADLSGVNVDATTLGIGASDISSSANANTALGALDTAIDAISADRATIGSFVSRFEYRGEYIESAIENLSAAKSSIMDVDIASEQTNLVAKQVLTEASIAALAQANQSKASLLALLR